MGCLASHLASKLGASLATALSPCEVAAPAALWDGALWFVQGSGAHDDGGGLVDSCTDEVGGADFTQSTEAERFTLSSSPARLTGSGALSLRRGATPASVAAFSGEGPGAYSGIARIKQFGTGSHTLGGLTDTPGDGVSFNLSETAIEMVRTDAIGVASETWSRTISELASNTWVTVAFSFDGTDCQFYLEGAAEGAAVSHAALDIFGYLTPIDFIGSVDGVETQDFEYGAIGFWPGALNGAAHAAKHAALAALFSNLV